MRTIKKYANRKLYDTEDKKYISRVLLKELIRSGEEVEIIDNTTGEDITASIVSQLLGDNNEKNLNEMPPSLLFDLLRKGSGTILDYAKKYTSLWQGAFGMAEDEIDKLIKRIGKESDLPEHEKRRLKDEILDYANRTKSWIQNNVDQRIDDVLERMNLATKDQVLEVNQKVEALMEKIEQLEKLLEKTGK